MHKIICSNRRQIFRVEQQNGSAWIMNRGGLHVVLVIGANTIKRFVPAIVKQVVRDTAGIAPARIRRAKPNGFRGSNGWIRSPRHVAIQRKIHHCGKPDIPRLECGIVQLRRRRSLHAFLRQKISIVPCVKLCRQSPLFQIAEALRGETFLLRLGQCWQKQRRKNCDDGNHHEQFDQSERAQCFHKLDSWLI